MLISVTYLSRITLCYRYLAYDFLLPSKLFRNIIRNALQEEGFVNRRIKKGQQEGGGLIPKVGGKYAKKEARVPRREARISRVGMIPKEQFSH